MEERKMMDRLKLAVLQELRSGTSPTEVMSILYKLSDYIADAQTQNANPIITEIAQAIHDADFRP